MNKIIENCVWEMHENITNRIVYDVPAVKYSHLTKHIRKTHGNIWIYYTCYDL